VDDPLDNPVYAALTGPQAGLAEGHGSARRYPTDVAPFLGLAALDERGWADAAVLAAPGDRVAVVGPAEQSPVGWEPLLAFDVVQLAGVRAAGTVDHGLLELGPADVPEMLELTRLTNPGPFLPRTIELGRYLGLRDGGELVAMAGERMHLEGWVEVSAVCTAPSHRGRGFASRLVRALVAGIEQRGARPFLHTQAGNPAIPLYEKLGFEQRTQFVISVLRR
jgi:ribosomal protein S18 acetylase RimI-like enzyme